MKLEDIPQMKSYFENMFTIVKHEATEKGSCRFCNKKFNIGDEYFQVTRNNYKNVTFPLCASCVESFKKVKIQWIGFNSYIKEF